MNALQELLAAQVEEALREAVSRKAEEIAGAKLYTGTAAIETFGLTRSALAHIPETLLPGRRKPLYSAASILSYIAARTISPRSKS